MVKCSRCGVEIYDSFEICPNCGNNLAEVETPIDSDECLKCPSCGESLNSNDEFCSNCGTKIANDSNKCESCGSEVPEGVLFCPICGAKVKQPQKTQQVKICRNCGSRLDADSEFCSECGTNINTGKKANTSIKNSNHGFIDRININTIIKPTILALVEAIILSIIGVLIGFSWVSFVIAIILSVGFFAGLIDTDANAVVSGLIVGLILGLLENPIIEFCWGAFVARVYEWYYGGQILILIIIGILIAYVSNVYLKSKIQDIVGDRLSWL